MKFSALNVDLVGLSFDFLGNLRMGASKSGTLVKVVILGALKTRDWKTQNWKTRHQIAGVENAGPENGRTSKLWKAVAVENVQHS